MRKDKDEVTWQRQHLPSKLHELVAQEPGWVGQTLLDTIQLMQWVIFAGFWCHNPLPLQTVLHQPLNPSKPNCICRRLTCQWPITLIIPSNDFGLRGQTIKKQQQLKRMSWVRTKTPVPSGCLPHFWGGKSNIFLAVYKEMKVIFILLLIEGEKAYFAGKFAMLVSSFYSSLRYWLWGKGNEKWFLVKQTWGLCTL